MTNKSIKKSSEYNIIDNTTQKTSDKKNEGCNDWNSVPRTYDKEESCKKHEKTATNNQWCSCNK